MTNVSDKSCRKY